MFEAGVPPKSQRAEFWAESLGYLLLSTLCLE